jgi:hypothetical protein
LPNVWANTRFAPTSDAGFLAIVGANLVFAVPKTLKLELLHFNPLTFFNNYFTIL